MRRMFLIVGALLAVLVAAGIFMLWKISQPKLSELPVAIADIPAGTVLRPAMFKAVTWANLDADTLKRFITVDEWQKANGKSSLTDISAGYPIAESQIDPNSDAEGESRLSRVISGTKTSYMVIPVSGDVIGNYVQPGDHIDLIVSLGDSQSPDFRFGPDGEMMVEDKFDKGNGAAPKLVEGLAAPFSKLIVQNLKVIRIDREAVRDSGGAANAANPNAESERVRQLAQAKRVAEVKRLYIEVTRDQYEVLGFVLNTGKRNFAVRAATGDTVIEPSEGVTYNDFMRWFYIQRNKKINVDSFLPASPYTAAPGAAGQ